jgi:hypothetical protein
LNYVPFEKIKFAKFNSKAHFKVIFLLKGISQPRRNRLTRIFTLPAISIFVSLSPDDGIADISVSLFEAKFLEVFLDQGKKAILFFVLLT